MKTYHNTEKAMKTSKIHEIGITDSNNDENGVYTPLTDFLPIFQGIDYGKWIIDKGNDGSPEHPIQMPYEDYENAVTEFKDAVYQFIDAHEEMALTNYGEILERAGLKWDSSIMKNADVSALDGQTVMALIIGAIRAERFCDGALLSFLKERYIEQWLMRLQEIDYRQV